MKPPPSAATGETTGPETEMPLDPSKLAHVRPTPDGGFTAQCPACADAGGDSKGIHLRQFPDGPFACVTHPGDREHRRAIYAQAGDKSGPAPNRAQLRASKIQRHLDKTLVVDPDRKARAIFSQPWTPAEIRAASPSPIPENPTEQAMAVIQLFRPRDVVWIGDHTDSGQQRHARNFKTASQWLRKGILIGPRICPAAFIPGTIVRARRTVRHWRFLVVESDSLTKPEQGAVFRWLTYTCHFRLRAVIDTGGRSLHGWFDLPPKTALALVPRLFPLLHADPALLNPAQPCRLPGWPRDDTGKLPSLIYLQADTKPSNT